MSPADQMHGAVPAVARDAFDRIRAQKKWVEVEGGHFGLLYHPSPEFEHAASVQAGFLSRHLVTRR